MEGNIFQESLQIYCLNLYVKLNSALVLFHYQYFPHGEMLGITNHPCHQFYNHKVRKVTTHICKNRHICARCQYPTLPRCHPSGSATHAKDIRRLCVCVRGWEKADPSFCLLLDSITGARWTLWWFYSNGCHKRYLLNFNWRPRKRLAKTLPSLRATDFQVGTSHKKPRLKLSTISLLFFLSRFIMKLILRCVIAGQCALCSCWLWPQRQK